MLKLLIADDERIIRETISSIIPWSTLNIEVAGLCSNGLEAYDMIIDESPDIVMTDIKMPIMSGLELIKRVAETDLDTQFIILSGYGEFEYAKEAMKYGVKQYILKPCNEEQITESVIAVSKDCYDRKRNQVLNYLHDLLKESDNIDVSQLTHFLSNVENMTFLKQISDCLLFETKLRRKEVAPLELTELLMAINEKNTDSQIYENLNHIIHKMTVPRKQSENQFLDQIYSYVETHLSDSNITLKEIAENQLFMNVDYVSKRFIKETGRKFSDYLSEVRITKAKQYLAEGLLIQEVAEKIGCGNNPHYFSQLFKKKTGMTASAYISQLH